MCDLFNAVQQYYVTDFTKWHILAITIKLLNAKSQMHSRRYTVAIQLQIKNIYYGSAMWQGLPSSPCTVRWPKCSFL